MIHNNSTNESELSHGERETIYTTLFDVVGAVDEQLSKEDRSLTPLIVRHLIKCGRVICTGNFKGKEIDIV